MSITRQLIRGNNTSVEAATLLAAQYAFDTTKNEATVGTGSLAGGVRLHKKNNFEILIPAQLTANQNDYNPTGLKHAGVLAMSTSASWNLTGIVAVGAVDTVDGREITIYNAGTFNLVVQDQNAASSAANRFDLGGADITLSPKQSITLRYRTQGSLNRWEIKSGNYGQAITDNSVSARKLATSAMGMNMINGTLVSSVAGSALTIAIKTLAGNDPSATDPVYVMFRDVTSATGDFVVMTLTAAVSFVASSGSALGAAANSTAFRVWVVGFNDAGTFRLGVINCLSGSSNIYPLGGFGIASSTAEGGAGAADSAQVFYTGAAVTSKAYTVLGYLEWATGLAAVGTWSAGPSISQLFGHGVSLPGSRVQRVKTVLATVATGTTVLPGDDTTPQNNEGDQYLTLTMTPSAAANIISKRVQIPLSNTTSSILIAAALFRDSGAAIATDCFVGPASNFIETLNFAHDDLAGSTVSTTYKLRAGAASAGTTTVNGNAGARYFNGSMVTSIEAEEIMA